MVSGMARRLMGVADVGQRAVEEAQICEVVAQALLESPQGACPLLVHSGLYRARGASPFPRSKTTRPPATVRSTGVVRIWRGGMRNRSAANTARSASMPGASVPFSFSANSAYADPRV